MSETSSSVLQTLQGLSAGQWLDGVLGLVILACALGGLRHGAVRELLGFAGLLAAFVVAGTLHRPIHVGTGIDFGLPAAAAGAGAWYVLLWLGTLLVFRIAAWLAGRAMAAPDGSLPWKQRLVGALFGTLKGGALVGFASFFAAAIDPARIPLVGESASSALDGSRAVRAARENPQAVAWLRDSQVVAWASDRMLDVAADGVLARDLGIEDPALRASARALMRPILANPESARLLGQSATATAALGELDRCPAFAAFAAATPEVGKLRSGVEVDPARLRELIRGEAFRSALRDPRVLGTLRAVDYAAIARELGALAAPPAAPSPGDAGR